MIKLETHLHVRGGSHCAVAKPSQIVSDYLAMGYGGIVVTNHYNPQSFFEYEGANQKQKLDFYFSLVKGLRKEAEREGIKVFFGAEITADTDDGSFQEFMLYGFEEELLYNNKPLFCYDQKGLFELAEKNNLFLYQTHPFRSTSVGVVKTGDPKFLHGAEAFNGHKWHFNDNVKANEFCERYDLIKMSGSDYHNFGQSVNAGIYIPDDISTNAQLKNYIMKNDFKLIINEEVK